MTCRFDRSGMVRQAKPAGAMCAFATWCGGGVQVYGGPS